MGTSFGTKLYNAVGESILNFYIFKGKQLSYNFIKHCETGASMALNQRHGWAPLFSPRHGCYTLLLKCNLKEGAYDKGIVIFSSWMGTIYPPWGGKGVIVIVIEL